MIKQIDEEKYFPEKAFEILYQSEEKNFWFRVRNNIIVNAIARYLPLQSRILEVGCGTGYVSHYLKQLGFHIECLDLFSEALDFCKMRDSGYAYYHHNFANRLFLEKFDGVCAFDVLEHIEDDNLILRNMYDALKPGGYIFITVPADMRLWSAMDIHAEHKRRYSMQGLQEKIENNRFNVIKISYFMSLLYPVIFLQRKLSSEKQIKQEVINELQPNIIINSLFLFIFGLEIPLLNLVTLPFGSSLICIAKKEVPL
ncbi:MAG: class I SAM-dependent methyltransferase [Thermoplasmata archaeon]|nr:class I SAM-dependent methyltransferase [Thermoplasmata archaeon]